MKYPELKDKLKTEQGVQRTLSLFHEMHRNGADTSIYTLEDEDVTKKGIFLRSAKKIYMEAEDLTEYEAGIALVGDYKHWKKIRATKLLAAIFDEWNEELEIKLRSRSIKAIGSLAGDGGSPGTALNAAKYIANGDWNKKRGRPSKEDVQKETRIQAGINRELDDDFSRILGKEFN